MNKAHIHSKILNNSHKIRIVRIKYVSLLPKQAENS